METSLGKASCAMHTLCTFAVTPKCSDILPGSHNSLQTYADHSPFCRAQKNGGEGIRHQRTKKKSSTSGQQDSAPAQQNYSQVHLYLGLRLSAACFWSQCYLNHPPVCLSFLLACFKTSLSGHRSSTCYLWLTYSCKRAESFWFLVGKKTNSLHRRHHQSHLGRGRVIILFFKCKMLSTTSRHRGRNQNDELRATCLVFT